jgi:hypothetical protein
MRPGGQTMTAERSCVHMKIFEKTQNISQDKNQNSAAAPKWILISPSVP